MQTWIPACAGMTVSSFSHCALLQWASMQTWIPACAGMTVSRARARRDSLPTQPGASRTIEVG